MIHLELNGILTGRSRLLGVGRFDRPGIRRYKFSERLEVFSVLFYTLEKFGFVFVIVYMDCTT
jgi:hypothetical protein